MTIEKSFGNEISVMMSNGGKNYRSYSGDLSKIPEGMELLFSLSVNPTGGFYPSSLPVGTDAVKINININKFLIDVTKKKSRVV